MTTYRFTAAADTIAVEMNAPIERAPVGPHAYEPWPGNHRWRTCRICGRGANAKIHKVAK